MFLLLDLEFGNFCENILDIPDHDEPPVIPTDNVPLGKHQGTDRMCVPRQYSNTTPVFFTWP